MTTEHGDLERRERVKKDIESLASAVATFILSICTLALTAVTIIILIKEHF